MAGCLRIAFAGGGTGGHLYPAINLARMFEKSEKCEIIFFGTDRGLEAKKIPELGYKLEILNVRGFHREFSFQNLLFFFRLLGSLYKSKKILKNFKPHVVIGTGGYVMGPALKMAIKLGITTVIQEQNSFPGVTTRMLAKDVDVVFTAYKQAADHLKHGSNIIEAGNPVFIKKDTRKKAEIFQDFGKQLWSLAEVREQLPLTALLNE
jgi:UDP-N-acetylglucosamine--N-acetylmuramyl-(pentapeptide) pyrophosphoryl-undecaprenol N-acetylglucosamine transferase